ncbi:MAG TPA: CpaF family protein [Acidiphilium sp.]|nr:MAG: pilus assembly protein CpaF [Acidiphilium sp. 21-60-14]OYV91286.1 MAG: pilus assembly protein CpaF [Acidiphilium sp. 37-60-79]OZB40750.1 MAG: pilus assembly protein CpaF [Acidiphilium sp. 34-60-192]HQT88816.1 CpaF family protein [Acidiphilium sp.]HQU23722.1 CpaF family protein [Acidiphilium sp.]
MSSTAHVFGRRTEQEVAPIIEPQGDLGRAQRETNTSHLRGLCLTKIDAASLANLPNARIEATIEQILTELATEHRIQLNAREQRQLAIELVDDMIGLGPLESLLADDSITDIMVNGHDRIFVERSGKLEQVDIRFRDNVHATNIAQRIASTVGRRVDEASPMVDARLKDGSRVNIVLPPLAIDGPCLSIRKFAKKSIDFKRLVQFGTMTTPIARLLEIAARCRLNVVISGGTGSGKTTLMNAMSRFIETHERIVTVEDAAELQLQQPHVVRLETRPQNLEGRGEINQRDLVRNALRMRPDRIIIGEVRGTEAFDMLQAMNTGHDGSMSTIHANNTRDALARIENMVQMASMGLTLRAIRQQVVSAVDLFVQVERQRDGVRRLVQITEVAGIEEETVLLNDIVKAEILGEDASGKLTSRYVIGAGRPCFQEQLTYFGLLRSWTTAIEEAQRGAP